MAEMGHTTSAMALSFYAKVMRRGEDEKAELAALVEGGGGSPTGEPALSPIA
jgi:hypothetical protein